MSQFSNTFLLIFLLVVGSSALSCSNKPSLSPTPTSSRRSLLRQCFLATTSVATASNLSVPNARAAADCFADCFKNCKLIAPNDLSYCKDNCSDYCAQPDRNDGLSGSVSASGGEVGILGGTFGAGTVVKGEDKPPVLNLPGLDFTNNAAGRKLIGY